MTEDLNPKVKASFEDLRLSVLARIEQMEERLVTAFRQSAARIESMQGSGPEEHRPGID